MKKLLLILLCVPLIGFGQDIDIDYGENTPDSILWNGGFDIRDRWYPPDSLCISGDCENGVGIFYFKESEEWFGERAYVIDASKYIGEWKNKKKNGIGAYVYFDETGAISNIYIGEWKDGLRHGKGTYTLADGTVESGQWENDKFIGE